VNLRDLPTAILRAPSRRTTALKSRSKVKACSRHGAITHRAETTEANVVRAKARPATPLGCELTVPEVAQSLVLTRMPGRASAMPGDRPDRRGTDAVLRTDCPVAVVGDPCPCVQQYPRWKIPP